MTNEKIENSIITMHSLLVSFNHNGTKIFEYLLPNVIGLLLLSQEFQSFFGLVYSMSDLKHIHRLLSYSLSDNNMLNRVRPSYYRTASGNLLSLIGSLFLKNGSVYYLEHGKITLIPDTRMTMRWNLVIESLSRFMSDKQALGHQFVKLTCIDTQHTDTKIISDQIVRFNNNAQPYERLLYSLCQCNIGVIRPSSTKKYCVMIANSEKRVPISNQLSNVYKECFPGFNLVRLTKI